MGLKTDPGYLRQLDGLRAASVAVVAWSHWRTCWNSAPPFFPGAETGVETFFVISGFLITGILLDNRSDVSRPVVLKHFYIRRFLRIFPLFYATIALALLLQASSMPETWYWHASYLSNLYFYLRGWCGSLGHFWSLAVEEQFYLFWPLLMLTLPARFLRAAIAVCILLAPIYALLMNAFHPGVSGQITASILMPSCMSALGMGALIAHLARQKTSPRPLLRTMLGAGLVGMAVWQGCGHPAWLKPFNRLAEDGVLGWLVYSAAQRFTGPVGWVLECAPMNYLGKISYGLYVIHNFANSMISSAVALLGTPPALAKYCQIPVVRFFLLLVVTIGLASLSWHLFEKPINNLKRHFPYSGKA